MLDKKIAINAVHTTFGNGDTALTGLVMKPYLAVTENLEIDLPGKNQFKFYNSRDYAYMATVCSFENLKNDKNPTMADAAKTLVQAMLYSRLSEENPDFPQKVSDANAKGYALTFNENRDSIDRFHRVKQPVEDQPRHLKDIQLQTEEIIARKFGAEKLQSLKNSTDEFYEREQQNGVRNFALK